jgi:hypothetical protein
VNRLTSLFGLFKGSPLRRPFKQLPVDGNESSGRSGEAGHNWPTPQQELLLRACLLQGEDAIRDWEAWRPVLVEGPLDPASCRFLPLLYHNLMLNGVNDPLVEKLKEVYLRIWGENHLRFQIVTSLLKEFNQSRIETMLLKGTSLTLLMYEDYGLRPMGDIDLLVKPCQAGESMRLLAQLGWKSDFETPEAFIFWEPAVPFSRHASECEIDLHWRLLDEGHPGVSDVEFWDQSIPIEVDDLKTRSLNPTDLLLHVCVHGTRWSEVSSVRWVADAMIILRSSRFKVDWSRLIEQAQKRHLTLPLKDTLSYLLNVFAAPVPPQILQSLESHPAVKQEQLLYQIRSGSNRSLYCLLGVWRWARRLRQDEGPPLHQRLIDWLSFLQIYWGKRHWWQLPPHFVLLVARRTLQIVGWYLFRKAHGLRFRTTNEKAERIYSLDK